MKMNGKTYQIFTFGSNHRTAEGKSLGMKACMIEGDYHTARNKMVKARWDLWAFQYDSCDEAGVARFGLDLMEIDEVALTKKQIQQRQEMKEVTYD